jgi:predicted flap endonuclease-1-like 5' DNA nuclease
MTKLTKIEGIGEVYAAKLQESGIITQADLLAQGAAPAGRKAIAKASGISPKLILKWLNRADLARVKGIGEEYADLLEYAGVDTVPELARRNPANLYAKLETVNEEKSLTRRLPSEAQVAQWVEQAKSLPRAIRY